MPTPQENWKRATGNDTDPSWWAQPGPGPANPMRPAVQPGYGPSQVGAAVPNIAGYVGRPVGPSAPPVPAPVQSPVGNQYNLHAGMPDRPLYGQTPASPGAFAPSAYRPPLSPFTAPTAAPTGTPATGGALPSPFQAPTGPESAGDAQARAMQSLRSGGATSYNQIRSDWNRAEDATLPGAPPAQAGFGAGPMTDQARAGAANATNWYNYGDQLPGQPPMGGNRYNPQNMGPLNMIRSGR